MIVKKLIYKFVLKDLSKIGLLRGIYDANNGSSHFMYGVELVMETIASKAGGKLIDSFADEFSENMIKSEERAKNEREQREIHKPVQRN